MMNIPQKNLQVADVMNSGDRQSLLLYLIEDQITAFIIYLEQEMNAFQIDMVVEDVSICISYVFLDVIDV